MQGAVTEFATGREVGIRGSAESLYTQQLLITNIILDNNMMTIAGFRGWNHVSRGLTTPLVLIENATVLLRRQEKISVLFHASLTNYTL